MRINAIKDNKKVTLQYRWPHGQVLLYMC